MAMSNHPSLKPPDPGTVGQHSAAHTEKPISFAAALNIKRPPFRPRFSPLSLPSRQVGSKEGRPAISFTGAEINACEKCLEFSLVAKFTFGRPSLLEIQKEFQQAWNFSGRASISQIWDARHVLIVLDSEADVRVALSSPLNKIGHAFFRLFRWRPDYNPKKESKFATIWVRLPDLPLSLYDSSFVDAIVSTFGYFVDVDEKTKALAAVSYARACVELDVTVPIPDSVWISLPNEKGYWQSIVVESKLHYCSKCRMHGHKLSACRKANGNNSKHPLKNREGTDPNALPLGGPSSNLVKDNHNAPKVSVAAQKPQGNNANREIIVGKAKPALFPPQGKGPGASEQWTQVTSKRSKLKAKRGEFVGLVNTDQSNDAIINEGSNVSVSSAADVQKSLSSEEQKAPASPLDHSTEILQVADGKVNVATNPNTIKDIAPCSKISAELILSESGQYVHPAMVDHFNQIQEKAGTTREAPNEHNQEIHEDAMADSTDAVLYEPPEGNIGYITTRRKQSCNPGSKHCLSTPSP